VTKNSDRAGRRNAAPLLDGVQDTAVRADRRLLLSSLLLLVARGDGDISEEETDSMISLLSSHLGLRSAEALESLTTTLNAAPEDPAVVQRLRDAGASLSPSQKEEVLAMLLEVAGVDDARIASEHQAILSAARVLGFSADEVAGVYWRYFDER